MEYQRGLRVHRRLEDADGDPVMVKRSDHADAVLIFQGDGVQQAGDTLLFDRQGAIEVIDGLTAFLADTDNKGD
jgi:hypothetical protein